MFIQSTDHARPNNNYRVKIRQPGGPLRLTGTLVKHNQSRRRPGMEPAVKVVLTGDFLSQFTARATLKTRVFRGFKSSEKTGVLPG